MPSGRMTALLGSVMLSLEFLSPSEEKKSACTADSHRLISRCSAESAAEALPILLPPYLIVWIGSSRLSGSKPVTRPPSLLPPLDYDRFCPDPGDSLALDRLILRPLLLSLLLDVLTLIFLTLDDELLDAFSLEILT